MPPSSSSGGGDEWRDAPSPPSAPGRRPSRGPAPSAAAQAASSSAPPPPPPSSDTARRYPRTAAPFSPCARADGACHELEGIVQNVLGFPRLPPRLHRALSEGRLAPWNGAAHARAAERLCAAYGRELALVYVNRCPRLLEQSPAELDARAEALAALLQLAPAAAAAAVQAPPPSPPPPPPQLPALLRKCPELLAQPADVTRANYASLARALAQPPLAFGAQRCRAVAAKYPVALAKPAASVSRALAALRRLCASREAWSRDLADATPSLVAFFLADAGGGLRRLEFLSAAGAGRALTLREVLKPGDAGFARRHPQFPRWLRAVRARRDELRAAALRAELQQGGGDGEGLDAEAEDEEAFGAEEEEEEEEEGVGEEEQERRPSAPGGRREGGARAAASAAAPPSSASRFDDSMFI